MEFGSAACGGLLLDLTVAAAVRTAAWQYRAASPVHVVVGSAIALLLVLRRQRPWEVLLAGYDVAVLSSCPGVAGRCDRV